MESLSDLDDDSLLQIFNKLPMDDLLNVIQTSSRFKEIAKVLFPKQYFRLNDVRHLYEIYSDSEANSIVQNIRKLCIILHTKSSYLVPLISKICTKLQELTITNSTLGLADREGIIQLCKNIRTLHLRVVEVEDSFMKEILSENNGHLKVLSIRWCNFYEGTTFLKDLKKLEKISLVETYIEPISAIEFLDNNCDSLDYLGICTTPTILNETVVSKIGSKFKNLKTIVIEHHENGSDFSSIAKIPTLKHVHVAFNTIRSETISTFFEELAKTNSVELLNFLVPLSMKIEGPSIKMKSLKSLTIDTVNSDIWTNFHFENLPELEELWISSEGLVITDNSIQNLLQILPKLKALNLIYFTLEKNQCIVLEQFLAEQNRKLILTVDENVFNNVIDNPGDFKYLTIKKMECWSASHIFHLNS